MEREPLKGREWSTQQRMMVGVFEEKGIANIKIAEIKLYNNCFQITLLPYKGGFSRNPSDSTRQGGAGEEHRGEAEEARRDSGGSINGNPAPGPSPSPPYLMC